MTITQGVQESKVGCKKNKPVSSSPALSLGLTLLLCVLCIALVGGWVVACLTTN